MSGGHLTDHRYDLYRLSEWADILDTDKDYRNHTLAQLLRDLEVCLNDTDMTLSGDSSDERADKAWLKFKGKWLLNSRETISEIYIQRITQLADLAIKDLKEDPPMGEPEK